METDFGEEEAFTYFLVTITMISWVMNIMRRITLNIPPCSLLTYSHNLVEIFVIVGMCMMIKMIFLTMMMVTILMVIRTVMMIITTMTMLQ